VSYRCESCGKVVPNGTPMHKVVTQTRTKKYNSSESGTEIVEEKGVCPQCRPAAVPVQ